MFKAILVFGLLVPLGGCLQEASEVPSSPPATSPDALQASSSTSTSNQPAFNQEWPNELNLSGCAGFVMSVYGPAPLFSPAVPQEWRKDSPATRIAYFLYHCTHISFGPFERTATFVFEGSDAISPPEACVGGDYLLFFESVWLDDPEIAAFANSTYGLPTRLTTFQISNTTVGDLREIIWSWEVGNGARAEIHAVDLPGTVNQGSPIVTRFFWSNYVGVSSWDWQEDYEDDLAIIRDGYGTSPPPTLYGKSELPDMMAGPLNLIANGTVHAPIQQFGDYACEKPL